MWAERIMPLKNSHRQKTGQNQSHCDTELLMRSLHANMDSARDHVKRSRKIVAHSRELIARVRQSLARSRRIHDEMSGPANPWIQ